jgi:cytochrome c oxidase assembly protein Cox11
MHENINKANINKKLAQKLAMIAIAGLFFGFALAPLYNVLCKAMGLNGRADSSATFAAKNLKVDTSRKVTVLFTGNTMPGLTWSFHFLQKTKARKRLRVWPYQALRQKLQPYILKKLNVSALSSKR